MREGKITTPDKSKTVTSNMLDNVSDNRVFHGHDGQTFKNLKELGQGLVNMNDDTYMYHVNKSKNDFAKWVREVIGDQELATDLNSTMTRTDAAKKVTDRVYYFSSMK